MQFSIELIAWRPSFAYEINYTTGQKKRDTFYFSIENPIKLTLREQLLIKRFSMKFAEILSPRR